MAALYGKLPQSAAFLKLVADPNQRERLDRTFKKYFIYWESYLQKNK